MKWDDIKQIYIKPNFVIRKGDTVSIEVKLNQDIDQYDKENFSNMVNDWTYSKAGRYIKPFLITNLHYIECGIIFNVKFQKKDEENDELKLLCEDLLFYFNHSERHMLKWSTSPIQS